MIKQYQWLPSGPPAAVLVMLHGYSEHMGRWEHVARAAVAAGYAVYGIDQQAHGASEGNFTQVKSFDLFVADTIILVSEVLRKHPTRKCFLVSHSMGGAIAAKLAMQCPEMCAGVVFFAPAFAVENPPPRCLVDCIAYLAPGFQLVHIDSSKLARDPVVGQKYLSDPLVYHGGAQAQFLSAMLNHVATVKDISSRFECPFLILGGTEDTLVAPRAWKEFHANAPAGDKQLILYEGAFHELVNEDIEREDKTLINKPIREMLAWVKSRV